MGALPNALVLLAAAQSYGNFFARTGCNRRASRYLVGLSNMADANAHYDCKSTPQYQHSADSSRILRLDLVAARVELKCFK